jgi:colanic acid biosynthesis glycosyl transferase WcaI
MWSGILAGVYTAPLSCIRTTLYRMVILQQLPPEPFVGAPSTPKPVTMGSDRDSASGAPNFPEGRLFDGYIRLYQTETRDGIRVARVKTFIAPNQGTTLRILDFISFMLSSSVAGMFQDRPDVLVATSPQFFSAVAGWFIAAYRRVPFVFELSDLWPASISAVGAMRGSLGLRTLEKLELFLYRRSTRVVALTEAFRNDLVARGIASEKIDVITNGVDLSRYAPRPRDEKLERQFGLNGRFVVGYVGTHGMAHALERVLEAAEILRNDDSIRFLFVGTGAAREELVREAARRSLDNVLFVPSQPKETMPEYWSLCDLALVHLKDTQVFSTVIPSKIFEAIAMGIPILLAAPEGEASKIVRGLRVGVAVPAEKPHALARAVTELRTDQETRAKLRANAFHTAPQFSREEQARRMLSVLEQVCSTFRQSISSSQTVEAQSRTP